jgi:hypothetical protein
MTNQHNTSLLLPADVGGTLLRRIAHCQADAVARSASQAPALIDSRGDEGLSGRTLLTEFAGATEVTA